jgi:hypothetical protein
MTKQLLAKNIQSLLRTEQFLEIHTIIQEHSTVQLEDTNQHLPVIIYIIQQLCTLHLPLESALRCINSLLIRNTTIFLQSDPSTGRNILHEIILKLPNNHNVAFALLHTIIRQDWTIDLFYQKDHQGCSPLYYAVQLPESKFNSTCNILRHRDPLLFFSWLTQQNNAGDTPLLHALQYRNLETSVLIAILEETPNVLTSNYSAYNTLMAACEHQPYINFSVFCSYLYKKVAPQFILQLIDQIDAQEHTVFYYALTAMGSEKKMDDLIKLRQVASAAATQNSNRKAPNAYSKTPDRVASGGNTTALWERLNDTQNTLGVPPNNLGFFDAPILDPCQEQKNRANPFMGYSGS